jgi:aminocarboxymuconate-semialdehyde decarboxylase
MIIDWHTHVHPPREQARAVWKGRCPATIENVLRGHEENGIDISVISSAAQYLRHLTRIEAVPELCASNEYLASLRDKYPDKIVAFATCIPAGGEVMLRDLERAVLELDMRGVLISSSHRGSYPDDEDARPFFELVTALDVPVFIHPPAIGFGEERLDIYRLASSVGRPFDACLALSRLIVKGIYEDFPALTLVASHLGGGICEIIGRMDYAYEMGDEAFFLGSYEPMKITRKPSDYLKMMYMDSTSYHSPAVRCAIDTVGVDRIVFASDAPMLLSIKSKAIDTIRNLRMSTTEHEQIMSGTAKRLLKL